MAKSVVRKSAHNDWLEFDPGNANVDGGQNADVFTVRWCCCVWKGTMME